LYNCGEIALSSSPLFLRKVVFMNLSSFLFKFHSYK
jgi:hypothetical protein